VLCRQFEILSVNDVFYFEYNTIEGLEQRIASLEGVVTRSVRVQDWREKLLRSFFLLLGWYEKRDNSKLRTRRAPVLR
jgi:hypothetical protein